MKPPARNLMWRNHPMRRRYSLSSFSFQPCSLHPLCLPSLATGPEAGLPGRSPRCPVSRWVSAWRWWERHGRATVFSLRLNCCYEEVNLGTVGFAVFPPVFRPNSPWPNSSQAPLHPLGLDLQCPSLLGLHSPILVRILPSRFSQNLPPLLSDQIIHPAFPR